MTTLEALYAAFLSGSPVLVHWRTAAGDVLQQPARIESLSGCGRVVVLDQLATARHGRPIYRVRLLDQLVHVEPLPTPEGG